MATIWISSWQFECCGDLFAVGDEVELDLVLEQEPSTFDEAIGPAVSGVTHREDHHDLEDAAAPTTVRIRGVKALLVAHGPRPGRDPREHFPVEGTALLVAGDRLERYLPERDGRSLIGWLVDGEIGDDDPVEDQDKMASHC